MNCSRNNGLREHSLLYKFNISKCEYRKNSLLSCWGLLRDVLTDVGYLLFGCLYSGLFVGRCMHSYMNFFLVAFALLQPQRSSLIEYASLSIALHFYIKQCHYVNTVMKFNFVNGGHIYRTIAVPLLLESRPHCIVFSQLIGTNVFSMCKLVQL